MKKISILGSTGSIGTQALEVIKQHPDQFKVIALSAHRNIRLLIEQIKEFHPDTVCISDTALSEDIKNNLGKMCNDVLYGREGLLELAGRDNVDILLNGLVGSAGMEPTINAVTSGIDVALSNKESLVLAGGVITQLQKKNNVNIFPVDSEHSAIWQCLKGEKPEQVKRLILTGSGGPFRNRPTDTFSSVTVEEALRHPNWNMGSKITIDSATMMNKGLEVIEASWLFEIQVKNIDIVIHPQSIIHSMVEFSDGSVKAQLGYPDMKIPIQYSLTYPDHAAVSWEQFDLAAIGQLTFEQPNFQKFPCIKLAYHAMEAGGSYPVVLNVANDMAVDAFLRNSISFTEIPQLIEKAMEAHSSVGEPDVDEIKELMSWTYHFMNSKLKG
ncbi:MAG: 1-deoxy-D-xylulose-5-phosphate reductoisomerase [Candidatus Marinimicrobia bacterium]|nr:1-deoxy-D-xylulose-5-phosphate reductoisomerase [Candidatus Neomarinimicrobiota bacterium]